MCTARLTPEPFSTNTEFAMTTKSAFQDETVFSAERLVALLDQRSKHSTYQELHPCLKAVLDLEHSPQGKRESARWKYMAACTPWLGKRVLDIGANTGYFSMAAVLAGAREVTAVEGHAPHAEFIAGAVQRLGWQACLSSQHRYFDFSDQADEVFDIVFCLNVLHHLGDDFGYQGQDMQQAKQQMVQALQHLAGHGRHCWFQLVFNWKGDRHRPLFSQGLKSELIAFVEEACQGHWVIEKMAIYNPQTACYEAASDEALWARIDAAGEFLNRPLFLLRSLA